jgi:hypothetical protein
MPIPVRMGYACTEYGRRRLFILGVEVEHSLTKQHLWLQLMEPSTMCWPTLDWSRFVSRPQCHWTEVGLCSWKSLVHEINIESCLWEQSSRVPAFTLFVPCFVSLLHSVCRAQSIFCASTILLVNNWAVHARWCAAHAHGLEASAARRTRQLGRDLLASVTLLSILV